MSLMLSNSLKRNKWFIIVSCVVLLIVGSLGVALYRALSSPPRFRASSLVLVAPTSSTSGVLAESFQARAFQSMPGIHLEQRGSPGLIEIVAYATNAAEAQTNANQALYPLARAGEETFGSGFRLSIVRPALSARRASAFRP
jgi:uncharacterized protein involved in exopolysaccharide biosynthesis